MDKNGGYSYHPGYAAPPAAPPSYGQTVGGVSPLSPYNTTTYPAQNGVRIVTSMIPVGPDSTHMQCPNCQQEVHTFVKSAPGTKAYILSGLLCLFGCWCGCCLIPFCIKNFQDVQHRCPNCDSFLGVYKA